eukprot:CAMPEP_0172312482 /NCGR_PEP_ID=MMETSP1058-20130122/17669_1 /TAXON_ID=83371 /ORGANISM="Detonula confervacea, Strain CCMP 353" /LENGTH=309 /DNA_ID=CAMNT_0013025961 /DNA_START=25 /DNA_END=954 /DNA_ORIENTATION=+
MKGRGTMEIAISKAAPIFILFIMISSSIALSLPKKILVTGANSGIGLALTKQLVADHGCHVYLGCRNEERGLQAVEEVKATAGDSVEYLNIDVGNANSVKAAASSLSQKLGGEKLYAIVNNAGTGFSHGTSAAEILDTNTRGPRRVTNSFLPLLDESSGRIVNVGSGGGPRFFDGLRSDSDKERFLFSLSEEEIEAEIQKIESANDSSEAYRGSKALLACHTMDVAERYPNLLVSIITPGWIKTKMTVGSAASKEPHEGTVSLLKALFEELSASGHFFGSDGKRSPLHFMRNPGEPEYDGALPSYAEEN